MIAPPPPWRLATVSLLCLTCWLAGCASGDHPARGAASRREIPTLTGREQFFDGQVTAEIRVGAMAGFERNGDAASEGEGHHHRGRFVGLGPGMGRPVDENGPDGRGHPDEDGEEGPRPLPRAMAAPPVMIHLQLTNRGTEAIEVVVADFLSPLGNFVVTPDKLTLAPGQALEVRPMTSRLAGDVTGAEISLRLRLGTADETKVIALKAE